MGGDPLDIVNSNSWTNAVLSSAGITPDNGGDFFGPDLLHANQIDLDYFATNPDIGDLDIHNLDTDGDGQLDVFDDYPTDDSRH